jgi:hypothetical protein
MSRRYSRLLPLCVGVIDAALVVLDVHNQHVTRAVGWGVKPGVGAPPWPYQTPHIVLVVLNFPAYLLAIPLEARFRLWSIPWLVEFPAYLLWWWFAGYVLDCSPAKPRSARLQYGLMALSLGLVAIGAFLMRDAVDWWRKDCGRIFTSFNLIFLELSTPSLWCFLFAGFVLWFGTRRVHL